MTSQWCLVSSSLCFLSPVFSLSFLPLSVFPPLIFLLSHPKKFKVFALPNVNIFTVGVKRFRCAAVLFPASTFNFHIVKEMTASSPSTMRSRWSLHQREKALGKRVQQRTVDISLPTSREKKLCSSLFRSVCRSALHSSSMSQYLRIWKRSLSWDVSSVDVPNLHIREKRRFFDKLQESCRLFFWFSIFPILPFHHFFHFSFFSFFQFFHFPHFSLFSPFFSSFFFHCFLVHYCFFLLFFFFFFLFFFCFFQFVTFLGVFFLFFCSSFFLFFVCSFVFAFVLLFSSFFFCFFLFLVFPFFRFLF